MDGGPLWARGAPVAGQLLPASIFLFPFPGLFFFVDLPVAISDGVLLILLWPSDFYIVSPTARSGAPKQFYDVQFVICYDVLTKQSCDHDGLKFHLIAPVDAHIGALRLVPAIGSNDLNSAKFVATIPGVTGDEGATELVLLAEHASESPGVSNRRKQKRPLSCPRWTDSARQCKLLTIKRWIHRRLTHAEGSI